MVFQMKRYIDDIAGFIDNTLGSVFELSNNNLTPLALMVRQGGSFYEKKSMLQQKRGPKTGYHRILFEFIQSISKGMTFQFL
jgi:hypothetical protein